MKQTRFATLCAALGLAAFFNFSAQAQITVDGTREAGYGTAVSVQSITSSWGTNNTLASLSVKQEGSKPKLKPKPKPKPKPQPKSPTSSLVHSNYPAAPAASPLS